MKYFLILCLSSLLIACKADPKEYDYNLHADDVICKEIKREEEPRRYTTVIRSTKLCSFIDVDYSDKADVVRKDNFKKTVETYQKELDVKSPE